MSVKCVFNTVRERDMDLLFLEMIASDPAFVELVVGKTDLAGKTANVIEVELSRTETDLGESDITVLLEIEGEKYAFLIEDKVDAISQPEQYQRYMLRAEKGISTKKYKEYRMFIFCPRKYLEINSEAKKYERAITYEEIEAFLSEKNDPLSLFRRQQVKQAISKAKRPPEVILNEQANTFFRKYKKYQETYYPELDMRTKESSNGWWVHYNTRFGKVYIYHKMQVSFQRI